jgi:predicted nucleotidyltransferase
MIDMRKIQDFSEQVGRKFRPERILLFGSYAYGKPSVDSDVDILVIISFEGKNPEKATEIWLATKPDFPVDVMVRKPQEIHERLALGDPFVQEIIQKGISLYESYNNGMDFQS